MITLVDCGGACFHAKLCQDMADVFLDRSRATAEDYRDFAIPFPLTDPVDHLKFPRSQLVAG